MVFFQKGHTDGQQTWEEMLNIAKFWEKCKSKPQWGITSYPSKWLSLKCQQMTNLTRLWRQRKPSYTVGRNVNCFGQYRKQYRVSSNTKNKIILWSSNATLEPLSEENKTLIEKDNWISMFIAVLFVRLLYKTPKIWKQLKCSPTDEWIKLWWYRQWNTTQSWKMKFCHLQQDGGTYMLLGWMK